MNKGYKLFGQAMRSIVYIPGVVLWTIYIFPIVLGFTLLVIVGHVLIYPFAYVWAAFLGEKEPPQWWKDYPDCYLKWLKIGYTGMYRWLCDGFSG